MTEINETLALLESMRLPSPIEIFYFTRLDFDGCLVLEWVWSIEDCKGRYSICIYAGDDTTRCVTEAKIAVAAMVSTHMEGIYDDD